MQKNLIILLNHLHTYISRTTIIYLIFLFNLILASSLVFLIVVLNYLIFLFLSALYARNSLIFA